jgi:hypothetical protein
MSIETLSTSKNTATLEIVPEASTAARQDKNSH